MRKIYLHFTALLLLLLPLAAGAQTTTLFDFGSSWKYLDNGTNQGTAWSATGFSDATWSTGTGFMGYGDTWINTCVNACGTVACTPTCSTKYITTYFRKTITIADTAMYDSVKLSISRDDGMVVYVNGVEVWRDNMPTGTINYTSLAPVAIGGTDEYTPITKTLPISLFAAGTNVIAVEMHQQSGTSSDLTFNMQAIGYIRTNIINYDAPWKYLTTSTDQGATWRPSSFSDATWSTGVGHIGFGETWTNTCIPAGPSGCTAGCMPGSCTKYTTTYFRKTINLANPALFDSMRFSVFRDDGIVMYVNGTEVWRDNLPAGTISYSTFAPNNINGTTGIYAESLAVVKSIPISAFATGTNTIAIEVHQNSATSSDLDFDVQMVGVLHTTVAATPVTLSQGPYLQMGNKTAVSVRWRTNVASRSSLSVGTVAGTYPITVNDATALTDHELRVTGLTPDTKYFYRIGTDTSVIQGDTANFFVTAPPDTSTRHITLAAFGDCGRNDNSFQTGALASYQAYLASQNMKAADLMLLIGDNAYNAGTDAEYTSNFFSRYSSNVLKNHMLFPAPGNHDYANDATRQVDHNVPYYNLFSLPSAGECGGVPSGTEAYYSYDWGNVHILSLDSYGEENAGTTRLYDTLGAQVNWIKNDLAANNKKWTIVYFHHPPYTMGSHNSDAEAELVNIRQNFIRILERYGVDMVICGHSHDYERSYLLKGYYGSEASFSKPAHTVDSSSGKYNGSTNSCPYVTPSGKVNHGTVYVVSGSAGADDGVQAGYPHNALPFAIDDGGMFYVDIKDNRLDAKFLRRDNTIADQFTIMKDARKTDTVAILAGASATLSASWQGAYAWAPGVTTRAITVTPQNDTTVYVKDSLTNTCLTDTHFVDVQCTMPAFTSCPASVARSACNAVVTYTASDTARPAPALSYTFTGATTAAGSGTGSGATFSVGVTTVTITAANTCGSANCVFMVTVNPLPVAYSVTGGGSYCSGNTGLSIGLGNSQAGVTYQLYNGATAIGSPVAGSNAAITFGTFTTAATYSVLATQTATGCTANMAGSATVIMNALPAAFAVSGGGAYCAGSTGVTINIANTQAGVNYQLYNGATATGSAAAGTGSSLNFTNTTAAGTYTVLATNATTGCTSGMPGSAAVTVNPLPAAYNVTGGGSYCSGNGGVATGLDNSQAGVSYQLYNGTTATGSPVSGTAGAAISFGMQATAATYTVLATDAGTGCANAMTGSATVIENALPAVYNVTGTAAYCAGGAGVPVGISNSQNSVNYQLYNGAATQGSAVAGTGAAFSFGTFTTAAIYTVVATDAVTGCVSSMNGAATVSINAVPVVYTTTGGGSYCAGGAGVPVGISNSEAGVSYQLYNGSTAAGTAVAGTGSALDFGNNTAAGTYTVLATTTAHGCTTNMAGSAVVSINALPVAYPVTGGGNYCAGSAGLAIGLAGAQSGVNYQLYNSGTVTGAPVAGATGPLTFGLHTDVGNYTIVAVNATTACTNNMSGSTSIGINPLPSVYSVTGGGSYCAGGTGVHLGLGGSSAGISYHLYNGAAAVGGIAAGTGSPIDLGMFTGAGTYSVQAVNTATGCTAAMGGTGIVVINPVLVPSVSVTAAGGLTMCAGTSRTFTAETVNPGSAPLYQWFVNGTAAAATGSYTYVPVNGDIVSVTLTSNALCASPATATAAATAIVKPYVTPVALITATPGNIVCDGTIVTLHVLSAHGGTAPSYIWLKNSVVAGTDSTYTYMPAEGDDIILSMTSNAPCLLTGSVLSNNVHMNVQKNYIPEVTIASDAGFFIKQGQPVTLSATVVDGGAAPHYLWVINHTIVAGATNATYTSSTFANGDSVSCTVTGTGMCSSPSFNAVIMHVQTTGVQQPGKGNGTMSIIPNPNAGGFAIQGSTGMGYDEELSITVTNVLGQVVYTNKGMAHSGQVNERVQLAATLADGTYILSVSTPSASNMFHFVLKR